MEIKLTNQETRQLPAQGTCDMCKKENVMLQRTYYRYENVQCECHASYHFEMVEHCEECPAPAPPKVTNVIFKTS